MVTIKQAVEIATKHLRELYAAEQLGDVLLEEVAVSDDRNYWRVTLRFSRPVEARDLPSLLQAIGGTHKPEFKVFEIDRSTGELKSMLIRVV